MGISYLEVSQIEYIYVYIVYIYTEKCFRFISAGAIAASCKSRSRGIMEFT